MVNPPCRACSASEDPWSTACSFLSSTTDQRRSTKVERRWRFSAKAAKDFLLVSRGSAISEAKGVASALAEIVSVPLRFVVINRHGIDHAIGIELLEEELQRSKVTLELLFQKLDPDRVVDPWRSITRESGSSQTISASAEATPFASEIAEPRNRNRAFGRGAPAFEIHAGSLPGCRFRMRGRGDFGASLATCNRGWCGGRRRSLEGRTAALHVHRDRQGLVQCALGRASFRRAPFAHSSRSGFGEHTRSSSRTSEPLPPPWMLHSSLGVPNAKSSGRMARPSRCRAMRAS